MTTGAVPTRSRPVRVGSRPGRRTPGGRPARYAVLSVVSGGIAQAGLVVAYAGFGWGPTAAVLFSLAVSIGPSYWGSRRYVWAGLSRSRRRTEVAGFVAVALAGSGTAIALTHAAVQLGQLVTSDRTLLAGWASAGSVLATVVVWVARYVALDRLVFARPRRGSHAPTSPTSTHPAAPRPQEG